MDDEQRKSRRIAVIENIIENYHYRDSQMVLSFQTKLNKYLETKSLGPFSKTTWEIIYFLCNGYFTDTRIAVSDIYSSLDVSKTAVIRYLNRLENWGVVEKHHDTHDKRKKFLKFAPEFEAQIAEVVDYCADNYGDLINLSNLLDKAAEQQNLQNSLSKFREFAKVSSDWFWETDKNHAFTWFSKVRSEIGYFNPSRRLGNKRWEFHAPTTHREKIEMERHKADLDAGKPFRDFVFRVVTENGCAAWCAVNGNPIFDEDGNFQGYFGSGRDVTDRRSAIEDLRRSESQLREMNALVADCNWLLDRDLKFKWHSSNCDFPSSKLDDDVIGAHFSDCLQPVGPDGLSRNDEFQAVLEAQHSFQDVLFRQLNGPRWQAQWHRSSGVPVLNSEGNFDGYQGVCKDVTKQVGTEILNRVQKDVLVQLLEPHSASELIERAMGILDLLRPGTNAKLYIRSNNSFYLFRELNSYPSTNGEEIAAVLPKFADLKKMETDQSVTVLPTKSDQDLFLMEGPAYSGRPDCNVWLGLFNRTKALYNAALAVEIEQDAPFGGDEAHVIKEIRDLIELVIKHSRPDQIKKAY